MPEHEGSDSSSSAPGPSAEAATEDVSLPALDLAAALGSLDQATRDFTRRLGEAQTMAARAAASLPAPPTDPPASDAPAPTVAETAEPTEAAQEELAQMELTEQPSAEDAYAARLLEAEREARRYLERAKQRADSLVASMVAAVEEEAAEIRRDAEEGVRERWQEVESDAKRHLEEAVQVGNGIVAERQQRLSALSDGITGKAEILAAGLEDADRVRIQFEAFVRALAVTADRIAEQPAAQSGPRILAELRDLPQNPRPSAIAA